MPLYRSSHNSVVWRQYVMFQRSKRQTLSLASGVVLLLFFDLLQLRRNENEFHRRDLSISSSPIKQNYSGVYARVFERWSYTIPLPCVSPASDIPIYFGSQGEPNRISESNSKWSTKEILNSPSRDGLFFLKPYKTGSSTSSGVHIRIARNLASRQKKNFSICKSRFGHGPTSNPAAVLFANRLDHLSFLWTVVREPTSRVVSEFFHFQVSRANVKPSNENFLDFLTKSKPENKRDYYLRSLYTKSKYQRGAHDPIIVANEILDEYDFIGVTERLDESLVVLMMLLSLKMSDILYLSAKRGGYDAGGRNNTCTLIQPSFVSKEMQEYFRSDDWSERVKNDLAFYQAVNKSLDLTIEQIGRSSFQSQLNRFVHAKSVIQSQCREKATFPCDDNGNFQKASSTDCLWKDSGCGTGCLDDIATELGLW